MEYRSIQVHLFKLEYVFSVVSMRGHAIQLLSFSCSKLYSVHCSISSWHQVFLYHLLLELYLVDIWNYLNRHGRVFLLELKMCALLVSFYDCCYLADATGQDFDLLCFTSLIWLVLIIFGESK